MTRRIGDFLREAGVALDRGVWRVMVTVVDEAGNAVASTNSYTDLATGLHYFKEGSSVCSRGVTQYKAVLSNKIVDRFTAILHNPPNQISPVRTRKVDR